MEPTGEVADEMVRADALLQSLVGEDIDTLTVNSLDPEDAAFLALIVSKLSPMIGNLLERKITDLLSDKDAVHGMSWIRQDPGFPDALLIDRHGESTDCGYEVKAWYTLSTELTGRFRESVNLLAPRHVRVAIVAWHMSHIVYGTPRIVGVLTVNGESVARKRDAHYHRPPDYLCVEPQDTTGRTGNLQQTNVAGYKWQSTSAAMVAEAKSVAARHTGRTAEPHSPTAQALAAELMSRFDYRMDTNFAKIDRIDHPDIERFKSQMLAETVRGRKLIDWTKLLKVLNKPKSEAEYVRAEAVMTAIYNEGL